ncbi:MAG: hypothetical protein FWD61_16645 [Phycisphaerales bacterium]|nr:hypothetical protein [Phycisphaerales bacterium]
MTLKNNIELANTREKLHELEMRYARRQKEKHINERVHELTMVSLKRLINQLEHFSLARSVLEPRMAMRGFGSRFLRMSSRHDHVKNALKEEITLYEVHQSAARS